MTSKEIVRRAIRYQTPVRLPVIMRSLGVSDVGGCSVGRPANFSPAQPDADEWGCVWSHTEMQNMGQVKLHPLEDVGKLDRHAFPDYTDDSRYIHMKKTLDNLEARGKYVTSSIFMVLFERMHALHGFENTLVDLFIDRPAMEALADRIVDMHVTLVREIARRFPGRIDGWHMTDDWGTQNAAFVSIDFWMDFFYPRYKRIFDAMHTAGCDVWVHSCGKVNEIIEGYIRAGVDVVNLQQPRALGIKEIGQRYLGRIAFESLADIQSTLPTGDKNQVDSDVAALMTNWASPDGGFIFSDYGNGAAIGVDDDMKVYMYESFSRWSAQVYENTLPTLPNVKVECGA
jgi:hypothetical protein